jgi:hypothetical protein
VITNRELSIYRLRHPLLAVKEMFRKSKISRADAESGSRETGIYFSPIIMTLTEETYASTTKFSGVDQMAAHSASGLRIRTGLGA